MGNRKINYTISDRIRSVWAIIVFFFMIIILSPVCIFLIICSAGRLTNFVIENLGAMMGRPALYAAGIDFSINNRHPDFGRPCIYIVNHSTTLDLIIFLALGLPSVRFVAKHELQYNPLFFILGHFTGQIFIDRGKSDETINRLQNTCRRIKKNKLSVLMAPEGTRKHRGKIGPFKKGPFRMAMDLAYPVVPIYLEGVRYLNGTNNFWVKKGSITAHIYPPVKTGHWNIETLEEQIEAIRKQYLLWAEEDDNSNLQNNN